MAIGLAEEGNALTLILRKETKLGYSIRQNRLPAKRKANTQLCEKGKYSENKGHELSGLQKTEMKLPILSFWFWAIHSEIQVTLRISW